jgi:lipopolysaccharide transport system permease protein
MFVVARYPIVHLLGVSKLRERYARSKFGQLWVILSQLLNIIIFGSVWSLIWGLPIDQHLPYIGVGFIIYSLIASTLNESSGVIIADARYYINSKTPFMLSIFSHIHRSFIIFIYNIPSIILIIIWSDSARFSFDAVWLLFFLSLPFFLIPWCYIIAVTSTRYRDTIQLWGLVFQTAFLVSPLMWNLSFVPTEYHIYFLANPLAAYLEVLRNPIIGIEYNHLSAFSIVIWILAGFVLAYFTKKKIETKLAVWI